MIHSIKHQNMHSIYEVIAFLLQTTLNFQKLNKRDFETKNAIFLDFGEIY